MKDILNILFVGDIMGQPGKFVLSSLLPALRSRLDLDIVIANGENIAGGKGITPNLASKMFSFGVNIITSGNHIWKNRDVFKIIDNEPRLLRPINFPSNVPGKGWGIFKIGDLPEIAVINVMGRLNLLNIDCPFTAMNHLLDADSELKKVKIKIVDFHAETSSEKVAMGWHLDGRVSAIVGTHTHVQTADEGVLPKGTAYISDVGMTGPHDSVLGIDKDIILKHFITQMPVQFKLSESDLKMKAVLIKVETATGKAVSIERVVEGVQGYAPGKD